MGIGSCLQWGFPQSLPCKSPVAWGSVKEWFEKADAPPPKHLSSPTPKKYRLNKNSVLAMHTASRQVSWPPSPPSDRPPNPSI